MIIIIKIKILTKMIVTKINIVTDNIGFIFSGGSKGNFGKKSVKPIRAQLFKVRQNRVH